MSAPRPTFNNSRTKYTRSASAATNQPPSPSSIPQQEPVGSQHAELVRYLSDEWHNVMDEYERCQQLGQIGNVEVYQEKQPNPHLEGFKPFNLDEFILRNPRGKSK